MVGPRGEIGDGEVEVEVCRRCGRDVRPAGRPVPPGVRRIAEPPAGGAGAGRRPARASPARAASRRPTQPGAARGRRTTVLTTTRARRGHGRRRASTGRQRGRGRAHFMNTRALVWSLWMILLAVAMGIGATILTGTCPLLGLDLKGGVSVVEQPQGKVDAGILQEAVKIIDRRVNGLGVSNSDVTRQGNDIVIELPGAKNDTQVLKIVGADRAAVLPARGLPGRPVHQTDPGDLDHTLRPGPRRRRPAARLPPPRRRARRARRHRLGRSLPPRPGRPWGLAVRTIDARLASVAFPLAAGTTTSTSAKGTTTATSKAGATTTTNPGATTTTKPGATTATSVASTTTTTSPAANLCNLSAAQQEQFPTTPPSKDFRNTTVVLPYYVPNAGYALRAGPGRDDRLDRQVGHRRPQLSD